MGIRKLSNLVQISVRSHERRTNHKTERNCETSIKVKKEEGRRLKGHKFVSEKPEQPSPTQNRKATESANQLSSNYM